MPLAMIAAMMQTMMKITILACLIGIEARSEEQD